MGKYPTPRAAAETRAKNKYKAKNYGKDQKMEEMMIDLWDEAGIDKLDEAIVLFELFKSRRNNRN